MKFPSVASLLKSALSTFFRFPVTILLAMTATVFCIRLVRLDFTDEDHYWYWNVVTCAYLGMLLSVALTVLAEKRGWGKAGSGGRRGRGLVIGLQAGVVVLALLFYYTLPDHFLARVLIRELLLMLGLHWLIAVIGFSAGEVNGFWQYNKKLFLRILTSCLYTGVLYIGLSLALLAIEQLFKVHVESHLYGYIWCVLAGIFNTWFFLAGFPADYENPVEITDYPKGLKIFTQFVLLPLITVYMIILYAYLFKIIVTAHWPSGWVAYLVLGFSVAGILSLLLVYPLRQDERNKWISAYSRFFYFALLPLIVLLCCAIWKRVSAYGITELRYFVLLLAAWLLFMALYFLVSRKKDIRLIPLSLCGFAFLSCFGPWGAFGVSLYSQKARLKGLLVRNGRWADGKVVVAAGGGGARGTGGAAGAGSGAVRAGGQAGSGAGQVFLRDRKAISSTVSYIVEMHGYGALQPWFVVNLDSLMRYKAITGKWENNARAVAIVKLMNMEYVNEWGTDVGENDDQGWLFCRTEVEELVIPTEGATYLLPDLKVNMQADAGPSCALFRLSADKWTICLDSSLNHLSLAVGDAGKSGGVTGGADAPLVVDLSALAGVLRDRPNPTGTLPVEKMTFSAANGRWGCKLVLENANGLKRNGVVHITSIEGYMLVTERK